MDKSEARKFLKEIVQRLDQGHKDGKMFVGPQTISAVISLVLVLTEQDE